MAVSRVEPPPRMVTSPVVALIVAELGLVLAKVNAPSREEVGGASVKPGLEAV